MSLNVDDAYDLEYFHDMDGSDEPEEDEVDGPRIPEEENAPRLTTEEVNILHQQKRQNLASPCKPQRNPAILAMSS